MSRQPMTDDSGRGTPRSAAGRQGWPTMTHQPPRQIVFAVVHEPGRAASGVPYALELCGVPDGVPAQLIAARVAQRHRAYAVTVDDAGPGRHLLRLTAAGRAAPGADVLADVLAWAPGVE